MTVDFPYNNESNILFQIERFGERVLYRFVVVVMKAPFIVALALLLTVGLLCLTLTYPLIVWVRLGAKKAVDKMAAALSNISDRDAMIGHAKTVAEIRKLEDLISKIGSIFLFRPIKAEFSLILSELKRQEEILHKHLYAEDKDELTEEQIAELIEAFKPWKQENDNRTLLNA